MTFRNRSRRAPSFKFFEKDDEGYEVSDEFKIKGKTFKDYIKGKVFTKFKKCKSILSYLNNVGVKEYVLYQLKDGKETPFVAITKSRSYQDYMEVTFEINKGEVNAESATFNIDDWSDPPAKYIKKQVLNFIRRCGGTYLGKAHKASVLK